MANETAPKKPDRDEQARRAEDREWRESFDWVLQAQGADRTKSLLHMLQVHSQRRGVKPPFSANTPYINTIPVQEEPPYPGSREIERRIKSIIRWNAMAMVTRANRENPGIGGHISTFASAATLWEVAFHHFLRGPGDDGNGGDQVFFQGHASPGIYARAFLEGRLDIDDLENFRRELAEGGGLSSYPHPWLMPGFWEFPTVSMGLASLMAIYQARFNRYLENRGLKEPGGKVWAFLGDGEMDEPESLGAITLASREQLDNLVFVVNCNLQRLDGPVRGNGKIIQELEAAFRGSGWNVIKVIWGGDWDALLEKDEEGVLVEHLDEAVDGQFQKYSVESGAYIRKDFFAQDPRLLDLVSHLSDEQIQKLRRGGHDPQKVFTAYHRAMQAEDRPTVILAKTIKGYGLGEAGEGKNITHQQKKLNESELAHFRTRFGIPISDEEVSKAPFYRPEEDSPEIRYLKERREELGGSLPQRVVNVDPLPEPDDELFAEFREGTGDREASTTMVLVRMLSKMIRDEEIGKLVVPIIPDEARTFGMEPLFRQCGIYASKGQLYEPVDADTLLYYHEAKDGQILEEGITEAGSMSSFIAAGTAYATHGINTIPFFVFYSMFGFQRIGDVIWAGADMRTKGFLMGATSGRTTLNGEGLQHQDGHSHLLAYSVPNLMCYDPAYAYELALIIQDGIRRMYVEQEDLFYYVTVMNENYPHPPMPEGAEEGVLKGIYRVRASEASEPKARTHLLGSGTILNQVLKAAETLEEDYGVAADVWSVTSWKNLHRDGLECQRWNLLHPTETPKTPYVTEVLAEGEADVVVAATDYVKALPESVASWLPAPLVSLGTDGFGRSETREALRDFFEVDWRYVTLGALSRLARDGVIEPEVAQQAMQDLDIDPGKANPTLV